MGLYRAVTGAVTGIDNDYHWIMIINIRSKYARSLSIRIARLVHTSYHHCDNNVADLIQIRNSVVSFLNCPLDVDTLTPKYVKKADTWLYNV